MKKNVAVIVGALYGGGAERAAGLLSKYLSRFYNTYIFIEDDSRITYEYGGILVVLPPGGAEKSEACVLHEFKEKYRIECAISFMEHCNFLNLQSRGTEAVVFSIRTTLSCRKLGRRADANLRRLTERADHIVSVSEGSRYDLVWNYHLPPDFVTTVYNFLDKDAILGKAARDAGEAVPAFKGEARLVLHIGRLDKVKNQERLLTQFSLLAQREDVRLLMIGSGSEEASLRRRIHELSLDRKVMLLPYEENPFRYHKLADIFALTSRTEGMPNVLLEAMLLKTPVVSVDCLSGPRELLAEDKDYARRTRGYEICANGILVEDAQTDDSGETDYFCRAMQRLLTDGRLRGRLVENASAFVERYSNEEILKQWMAVIEHTVPKECGAQGRMIPALRDKKEVIVYGAGKVGTEVMLRLLEQRRDWEFICFAVTDKSTEKSPIEGVGLYELEELYGHRDEAVVVISVGKKYEEEVLRHVKGHGFEYTWGDV